MASGSVASGSPALDQPLAARHLTILDGVLLVTGVVVGTSIFRAPASIAGQTTGPGAMMGAWLLGGFLAFCGAICYTHLARAHPGHGGEYTYLRQALGPVTSFLFAWSRLTVLQTGSIAATAFVFGDYAAKLLSPGAVSPPLFALAAVIGLTWLNMRGLHLGKGAQNALTVAKVAGLATVVIAGFAATGAPPPAVLSAAHDAHPPAFGLAMVFVLYAYGGWNEASYLVGEVRRGARGIAWVLFCSMALVTAIYLAVNLAYLRALGFAGLRLSETPASDVVSGVFGGGAQKLMAAIAAVTALGTANATIFTGARAIRALGDDQPALARLAATGVDRATPHNAFALQGFVAAALILAASALGESGRKGFEVAVEYTAPAFWGFMTLLGLVSVWMALTSRAPGPNRLALRLAAGPFCALCAYMLHASVAYAGRGALLGLAVVALGVPVYAGVRLRGRRATPFPAGAPGGEEDHRG